MFAPEKFSDYVAILAFIVSCTSFYLSWKNFTRDRSHLKLALDFTSHAKRGNQFQVTITNDGRRTASLTRVDALLWFRKRQTVFQQQTVLTEGDLKEIFVPTAMIPSISNPLTVRAFEVRDSVGNEYRASALWLFWKIISTKN